MKRFLILAMVIGVSLTLATSALAGILTTRHNLSNSRSGAPTLGNSGGTVIYSTDQDQLCVWCHTPHNGQILTGVPLWNKSATGAAFTYYPTTVAGTPAVTTIYNSRACLTCHDGTLAVNIVVNAPGPGGVVATGSMRGTWQGLNLIPGAEGNAMPRYSAANFGINLSNDHPISIEFSGVNADTDLNPASLRQSTYTLLSTTTWISRAKGSSIGTIAGQLLTNRIECMTCHDPHSDTNLTFLRATTTGSRICISCHNK